MMLFTWSFNSLWKYAAHLPVEIIPVEELVVTLDETLTKREMSEETRRIMDANLEHSIIFSARGRLMDGSHKIMKTLHSDRQR